MIRQGMLTGTTRDAAVAKYIKSLNKGILKVMSKMGISTLASYCGAQIFEAIGLNQEHRQYFTHTTSRVSGVGIDVIAEEVRLRHERADGRRPAGVANSTRMANTSGAATVSITSSTRRRCSSSSTRRAAASTHLQGIHASGKQPARASRHAAWTLPVQAGHFAVPIEEVEPVENIVKRFATGAMSYGSISLKRTRRSPSP